MKIPLIPSRRRILFWIMVLGLPFPGYWIW